MKKFFRLLAASVFLSQSFPVFANDTAASIGAGGLVFKREPRISLEKERLFISKDKITVDYDFLNESDTDITTTVAFPLPTVDCLEQEYCPSNLFDDFQASANGAPISLSTETKALVSGKDYADVLRSLHVNIAAFGHFDPTEADQQPDYEVRKLTPPQQQQLMDLGLVSKDGTLFPLWTVSKTYYWAQTFPAHKAVHIFHQYGPVSGYQAVSLDELDPGVNAKKIREDPQYSPMLTPIRDSCIDARLRSSLDKDLSAEFARQHLGPEYNRYVVVQWVNYILKTANSWKNPIKDFTLVLEKPMAEEDRWYVSLCWDGKIERQDNRHLVAHAVNFVPQTDLTVAFLSVMPQHR